MFNFLVAIFLNLMFIFSTKYYEFNHLVVLSMILSLVLFWGGICLGEEIKAKIRRENFKKKRLSNLRR